MMLFLLFWLCTASIASGSAPCDNTFPGFWTCSTCKKASAYSASRVGANGMILVADADHSSGWNNATLILAPSNLTLTATYDNGHHTNGTVDSQCLSIHWSDKSEWAFVRSAAPVRVFLAAHSHDDTGWDETYLVRLTSLRARLRAPPHVP